MRRYRYIHLDVFTEHLFGGNQLAVFVEADGLSADLMQSIAKEMNFSESTFVLPPERPDTDIRLRIFTPADELPMAGHPTIGTAFALAHCGRIVSGQTQTVFEEGIGPVTVALEWRAALSFAWMTQKLPMFGPRLDRSELAARAIGLAADALMPGLPVEQVSCGVPFLFVPLSSRAAVDRAEADGQAMRELARAMGREKVEVFLFSTEAGRDDATAYSRMFAPGLGITEDPATGSASGPLGAYLVTHGVVRPERARSIISLQGARMGRPSHLHIDIGVAPDGRTITHVKVGGQAVVAGEGEIYIG